MLDGAKIFELQEAIELFFNLPSDKIFDRREHGTANFNILKTDYDSTYKLLSKLRQKNISLIHYNQAENLRGTIKSFIEIIIKIHEFNIMEISNLQEERKNLIIEFERLAQYIADILIPILYFLEIADPEPSEKNKITDLTAEFERDIKVIIEESTNNNNEIKEILNAAKNASSAIGSLPFSKLFKDKTEELSISADKWLKATIAFSVLTILSSLIYLSIPIGDKSNIEIYNAVSSKLILFLVLVGGTVWCGRIYKSLKHQEATNSHRATAIQTFEAFIAATKDTATQQAVLLETTRAIFAHTDTGLIPNSDASGSETKIIEMLKSAPGTHG